MNKFIVAMMVVAIVRKKRLRIKETKE